MRVTIYTAKGQERFTTPVYEGSRRVCKLMGDDYCELKFSLPAPVPFTPGDWADIPGAGRFVLTEPPRPSFDAATGACNYTLRMDAHYKAWGKRLFRFNPAGAAEASWNFTGFLWQHLDAVLANLAALGFDFHGVPFRYMIDSTVEKKAKLLTYSDVSIIDALSDMAKAWESEWWMEENVIHFGKCYGADADVVELDLDTNLESMSASASKEGRATRIYAYGSTRNLPANYRRRLSFVNSLSGRDVFDPDRVISQLWFKDSADLKDLTLTFWGKAIPTDAQGNPAPSVKGCEFDPEGHPDRPVIRLPQGYNAPQGTFFSLADTQLDLSKVPFYYYSPSTTDPSMVNAICETRLRLPEGRDYLDMRTPLDEGEIMEKTVVFEEVYPRMRLHVTDLEHYDRQVADDAGGKHWERYYRIKDNAFSFRHAWRTDGKDLTIVFESGLLAGMEFTANFNPKGVPGDDGNDPEGQWFEILANETYGRKLPDLILKPSADTDNEDGRKGDSFFITGWDSTKMAETGLIELAEQELLEKAGKYMDEQRTDAGTYDCTPLGTFMRPLCDANGTWVFPFRLGKRIRLVNKGYFPIDGYRDSRLMGYEYPLDLPYDNAKLTVGDKPAYSRLGELKESVEALTARVATVSGENGHGQGVYLIRNADPTPPSETNAYSALRSDLQYLSKTRADRTAHALTVGGALTAESEIRSLDFISGPNGTGHRTDVQGNMEAESLTLRRFLEVPELRFNRTEVICGTQWRAPGGGIVEAVDTSTHKVTLKLEEGEVGAVAPGDICMGIFHFESGNAKSDADDRKGNFAYAGFTTVYFRITAVSPDRSEFTYALRGGSWNTHPCAGMHFVAYGNSTDKSRQCSHYATRTYERFLSGVDSWEFGSANVRMQSGDLSGLIIEGEDMSGYSSYLDNVFFSGTLRQIQRAPLTLTLDTYGTPYVGENRDCDIHLTVAKGFDTLGVGDSGLEVWYSADGSEAERVAVSASPVRITRADLHEAESALLTFHARWTDPANGRQYSAQSSVEVLDEILLRGDDGHDAPAYTPNLLCGTLAFTAPWVRDNSPSESSMQGFTTLVKSNAGAGERFAYADGLELSAGKTYTLSFMASGSGGLVTTLYSLASGYSCRILHTSGSAKDSAEGTCTDTYLQFRLSSDWVRHCVVFEVVAAGSSTKRLAFSSMSASLARLCAVKLEEGDNGNTLWSPCPTEQVGQKGDKGEPGQDGAQGEKGDKGDKGEQGEAGAVGPAGAVVRVRGAFVAGVKYYDGTEADASGVRWRDIVWADSASGARYYFACVKTAVMTASMAPQAKSGGGNAWWQEMSDLGALYADMVFAANARIEFLSGQEIVFGRQEADGTHAIKGRIGVPLTDGTVMYLGGNDTATATCILSESGAVRFGTKSGKRIEIDPATEEIRVYDASGTLRVAVDGDDTALDALYGSADNLRYTYGGEHVNDTRSEADGTKRIALGSVTLGQGEGTVKAAVPVTLRADSVMYTVGSGVTSLTKILTSSASARLVLELDGQVVKESATLSLSSPSELSEDGTLASTSAEKSQTLQFATTQGRKGTYSAVLEVTVKPREADSRTSYASASVGALTASFKAGASQKTIINANGILCAQSTMEYLRAGVSPDGSGFVVEGVSSAEGASSGLRICPGGIMARDAGGNWKKLKLTFE